jgi:ribosomal protein L35
MHKGHKGLLKRIKVTGTGKVRFHSPNSRHLKSNKRGTTVQSYRKSRYLGATDTPALSKILGRTLRASKKPAHTGGKD